MTLRFRLPALFELLSRSDGFICFLLLFLSFKHANTSLLPPHLRPTKKAPKNNRRGRPHNVPGAQLGHKIKTIGGRRSLIIPTPLSFFRRYTVPQIEAVTKTAAVALLPLRRLGLER